MQSEAKRAYAKAYREKHAEKTKAYQAEYRAANRERLQGYNIAWRDQHPGCRVGESRRYRERHKDELAARASVRKSSPRIRAQENARATERYWTDPRKRREVLKRNFVQVALRRCKTSPGVRALCGCSLDDLRRHLASLFKPGMSWDNWGEWEIDHKRPVCTFDLMDGEQLKECFHFSNMQPLWKHENMAKGSKWEPNNKNLEPK